MKKTILAATLFAVLSGIKAQAQDIYQIEQISSSDLNGDARYVGMGGAMGALGANLSSMSNNPAASALYRRNDFSTSLSLFTGNGDSRDAEYLKTSKTKWSFDQIGLLYAVHVGGKDIKFANFGFNYRKSKNFARVLGLNNIALGRGFSQSWQLADLVYTLSGNPLDLKNNDDRSRTTPLTNVAYDTGFIGDKRDGADRVTGYDASYATAYHYGKGYEGGIEEYNFNLGLNYRDQVYLGVNLGVYSVDVQSMMEYEEASVDEVGNSYVAANGARKTYIMQHEQLTTGYGVDAKLGIIVRPLRESPFRLGFAVSTPTVYSLTTSNYAQMRAPYSWSNSALGTSGESTEGTAERSFEHRIRVPWKVNFSLGHTFDRFLALGLEYEIADHLSMRSRYLTSEDLAHGENYGTHDRILQAEIDRYLRDTHTLRVGMEAKLSPQFALRAGYNFVSAPFAKDAYLNLLTESPSYANAFNTDYVNLGDTHRLTLGLGAQYESFYWDLAYQYQTQGADVYAFHHNGAQRFSAINDLQAQHLNLYRHSLGLTVGWRF